MYKIVIICCYFGKMPPYFPAWVISCENNPTIDYLLVTDQNVSDLPENIVCKKSSLAQIRESAEDILGFEPQLRTAYKLCDYKVLYGVLFQECCKGYDFWGHCDMDMVFGDLRRFITEDVLKSNDRIYPYGHLALYRNTEECNRRFMQKGSPFSYQKVFTSNEIFFFDERCYIKICAKNGYPCYDCVEMADIRTRYRRFCVHENLKNYKRQLFLWHKGHVFRIYAEDGDENGDTLYEEEFPYIHFKRRLHMQENIQKSGMNECEMFREQLDGKYGFGISDQGFIILSEKPGIKMIEQYNPYQGSAIEVLESLSYEIKSKWKHINVKLRKIIRKY